jgi:hypothetical protein
MIVLQVRGSIISDGHYRLLSFMQLHTLITMSFFKRVFSFGAIASELDKIGKEQEEQKPFRIFPKFVELPPELRDMVWRFAISKRIVVIDHSFMPDNLVSRRNIVTPIPPLLLACHDSRQIAYPIYSPTFGPPMLGPLKWHYDGSLRPDDILRTARALVPNTYGTLTPTKELLAKINKYMGTWSERDGRQRRFAEFGRRFRKSKGILCPWFNADRDVLYTRFTKPEISRWTRGEIWSPMTAAKAGEVKHLAFELSWMGTESRPWSQMASYRGLEEHPLESVKLVLLQDCEVITIKVDDTDTLQDGQWSFSLDLNNEDFKEQMGASFTGVAWQVTLAKKDDDSLWRLAKTWRPLHSAWEAQKRRLMPGKSSENHAWYDAQHRGERWERYRYQRILDLAPSDGRKEHTAYLGFSRA